MINTLSIIGLIIGIMVIYSAATLSFGLLVTLDEQDKSVMFFMSWFVGMVAFVIVSMAALDAKGFINVDGSGKDVVITEEAKDD